MRAHAQLWKHQTVDEVAQLQLVNCLPSNAHVCKEKALHMDFAALHPRYACSMPS